MRVADEGGAKPTMLWATLSLSMLRASPHSLTRTRKERRKTGNHLGGLRVVSGLEKDDGNEAQVSHLPPKILIPHEEPKRPRPKSTASSFRFLEHSADKAV